MRRHPIENGYTELSGEVIVAEARLAQRRIKTAALRLPVGPVGEPLDHLGDLARGDAEEAMATLVLDGEQAAVDEPRQMGARGLRRGTGQEGKLARRPPAAIREVKQNGGAHRIADERGRRSERGRFGLALFRCWLSQAYS